MGSKMNPYGVGHSGNDFVDRHTHCDCCGMPFEYRTLRTQPQRQPWCPFCRDHHPLDDEDNDRVIARLTEHEPRLRQYADQAKVAADKAYAERAELRRKVARALETRDGWRDLLVEVRAAHTEVEGGECLCGLVYPCPTVEILDGRGGRSRWLRGAVDRRTIDKLYGDGADEDEPATSTEL